MANVEIDGVNSIVYTDQVDPKTGTTLTIGTSGDTVNLGTGVTAGTGFGGDLSFGGDTFGANKVIGANDAYSFSLETSGNTALTIDANGHVTMPLQSSFCATLSSTMSNVPINDSTVWIEADTEIWDLNSDWNTTTYTFTAPVTGKYHFHARVQVLQMDSAGANDFVLNTSNVVNVYMESFSANVFAADGTRVFGGSVIMDMDANDTAKFRFYQGGGTAQADINDGQAATAVSGYLLH
jgi:hypothetical protein